MRTASASATFAASVHEAEQAWYDTSRWPEWVDGLEEVLEVSGAWPATGATVRWRSGPAGRGTVTERVVGHERLAGQELAVQDDSIEGRQRVQFVPAQEGVEVTLTLQYELRQRAFYSPLLDRLFIRRAFADSLALTLSRFGAVLGSAPRTMLG